MVVSLIVKILATTAVTIALAFAGLLSILQSLGFVQNDATGFIVAFFLVAILFFVLPRVPRGGF